MKNLLFIIIFLISLVGVAQIMPTPGPPPPPGLPLGGFTGLLFAIGVALGYKKILKS